MSGVCEGCGVEGEFLSMSGSLFCEICGKKQTGSGGDEDNGGDEQHEEEQHGDENNEEHPDGDNDNTNNGEYDDQPQEEEGEYPPDQEEHHYNDNDNTDNNDNHDDTQQDDNNIPVEEPVAPPPEPEPEPVPDPTPPPQAAPVTAGATVAGGNMYAALAARRKNKKSFSNMQQPEETTATEPSSSSSSTSPVVDPSASPYKSRSPKGGNTKVLSNLLTSLPTQQFETAAEPSHANSPPSPVAAKSSIVGGASKFKQYKAAEELREQQEQEKAMKQKEQEEEQQRQKNEKAKELERRVEALRAAEAEMKKLQEKQQKAKAQQPTTTATAPPTPPTSTSSPYPPPPSSSSPPPFVDVESLKRQLRKEIESSFAAELEILTMENKEISLELSSLKKANQELKRTAEESMRGYEAAVKEKGGKSYDYTANLQILEAETQSIRSQYDTLKGENSTLKKDNSSLKSALEEKTSSLQHVSDTADKSRNEAAEWRLKYEELKTKATNNLKLAASEYLTLKASDTKTQQLLADSRRENATLQERTTSAVGRMKELEREAEQLRAGREEVEDELKHVKMEMITMSSTVSQQSKDMNELKMKADDAVGISTTYKQQVLVEREKVRQLEGVAKRVNEMESDTLRVVQEMEGLQGENQKLKIQLFDKSNEIQELSGMLEGLMKEVEGKGKR